MRLTLSRFRPRHLSLHQEGGLCCRAAGIPVGLCCRAAGIPVRPAGSGRGTQRFFHWLCWSSWIRYVPVSVCLLLYVSILILLSIVVNVVLCNVALYSKCLKQLLLLCNVALCSKCLEQLLLLCSVSLYSKCLKQCFATHIVASWYYCRFLLLWYYVMLYCTLSVYSNCC